jgi:hypothetical protein
MTTRIYNIRKRGLQPGDIYIGRAGQGRSGYFGNPIALGETCPVCGESHFKKGSTLPCFEKCAHEPIARDLRYREEVKGLYGKSLVCFCVPSPCHGRVLAKLAQELNPPAKEPDPIADLFGGS